MKRAFIFDLDGVIVDSERHWKSVSHEFLQGLIPTWGEEDQRQIFGLSARTVYELLNSKYQIELSWDDYVESYHRLATEIYGKLAGPVPGALEFIAFLQQAGYDLALASSAPRPWIDAVFSRFYLADRFSAVVAAEDVGVNIKPSPEPYLLAAQRIGRRPADCVAIEDSPKGIRSAKSAGMACLAIAPPGARSQDLSEADAVIGSFEEIPVREFDSWLSRNVRLPPDEVSS